MRFLIVGELGDVSATGVCSSLQQRHSHDSVRFLTSRSLGEAQWLSHRLSDDGVYSRVHTREGWDIKSDELGVVFNRLHFVDLRRFGQGAPADHEYANMEMFALLLSWLESLPCPVINAACPAGLSGACYRPFAIQRMAAEAGLPTLRFASTTSLRRFPPPPKTRPCQIGFLSEGEQRNAGGIFIEQVGQSATSVLVVGNRILGELPSELHGPCLQLMKISALTIARIYFVESVEDDGLWKFSGLDSRPHFESEEERLVVVELLEDLSETCHRRMSFT